MRFGFVAVVLVALVLPLAAWAEATPGLQSWTLDNGLSVFVVENHAVPLARIQITFRTGAMSQTPSTAGLFHLYEHMLFKGNKAHPTQTDLQAAMKTLGVADWNGGTNAENVTYYFTVPADRVADGIQFWADATRAPLLDPAELETEKNVVVSEILGYLNDPRNVLVSALEKALFWKYPWRKDVSGSEALVRAATVKDLQAIRDAWYVPNNAALFIGGDVDPRAVRAAVEKSFGDWPKAADPWASPPPPQEAPPRDVLLAFPDEQVSPGVVAVTLRYRGPDVTRDPTATWAADVWGSLLSDPNGRFVTEMARRVPGLYRKDYMSASYRTQRDGGYISFSTLLLLQKGRDTFGRAVLLKKAFANLCANMAADRSYFTKHDFEVLVRQLSDQRIWERETVDGFLDQLSFWWATAGIDYYNGYDETLAKVGSPEIATFLQGWVLGKTSVLAVRMNPDDFAKEKRSAERQGWTVVSADNAYWWKSTKTGGAR